MFNFSKVRWSCRLAVIALAWTGVIDRLTARAEAPSLNELAGEPPPSTQDLVTRLEAAEAELQYLRGRDEERQTWEESMARRLPDAKNAFPAVNYRGLRNSVGGDNMAACDGCGCQQPPLCPGLPPYCECCLDSLSWNNGSWRIVPFGFLSGEALAVGSATVSRPFILYLQSDRGSQDDQFTVHGQTTALGLNFSGPTLGDYQLGGMILFNFLGDRPALNQATPFFLRGYGELKNETWRFTFGQQGDLFNPLDPVTVNFGGHKQAGNGGSFRGSLRAERFIRTDEYVQWTLQAALSQQVVTDFVVNPLILGEDNGWPNIEGRIGLGVGPATSGTRPVELGVSGVIGETRAFGPLGTGVFTTWGVSGDARLRRGSWTFSGELFHGQALGTYNLGIGQSLEASGLNAIRTTGGWAGVSYALTPYLATHWGYGIDDPRNGDLGQFLDPDTLAPLAGQRGRNEVVWANLIWDVGKHFQVAFEVSHRETDYISPSVSNSAWVYHFRSMLKF